ncbi:hypothetical protein K488DRAFT_74877 [Vararia minispora EC-137]|uniref:Uncharacterized protein n=1 Tax=Vararia minispora EC-137 TaxID=1314806 RepID=A0ACB8Q5S3_9AGAM|nr:hypothetical protein K488DRAFT_74877 [Vararia minispora EC-137]
MCRVPYRNNRSSAPVIVLSAEFKVRSIWDRIFAERRGNNQENHEDDSEGRVVRRCSSAPAIVSYSEHGSRQPMDGKAEDNEDNGLDPAPASDHISPDDIVVDKPYRVEAKWGTFIWLLNSWGVGRAGGREEYTR